MLRASILSSSVIAIPMPTESGDNSIALSQQRKMHPTFFSSGGAGTRGSKRPLRVKESLEYPVRSRSEPDIPSRLKERPEVKFLRATRQKGPRLLCPLPE